MTINKDNLIPAVLMALYEKQAGNGTPLSGTASINIEVGYTSNSGQVQHDGIILKEANGAITQHLFKTVEELNKEHNPTHKLMITVNFGGLLVTQYKSK